MLKSFIPNTTYTLWLTNVMEFEETRSGSKYKGLRYGGFLAGDVMYIFSRWMYNFLADELESPNSRQLGFFNIANMTSSLVSQSKDGIHMVPAFYNKYMLYVFRTLWHGM